MLRRWVSVPVLTMMLTAWFGIGSFAVGEVLTLESALAIALDDNPSVENAQLSVEKLDDDLSALRTKQYPGLSTRLRESYNLLNEEFDFEQGSLGTVLGQPVPNRDIEIETKSKLTTIWSVEAKQPLVGLYQTGLDIEKLEVQRDLAYQQQREKRQEIAREVKEQYYEILETQSALEATEESIAFYKSLETVVANRVKQQTALEYELLDTQASLAESEHNAFKQRNTLLDEKERLNELLGRDIATPFTVTSSLLPGTHEMDQADAQEQALAQRPEAQEARLKLSEAQKELEIRRSKYLPDVDLVASYSRSVNTDLIPDESAGVALVLRWEFFDWGRRADLVSKARRGISQAHNDIREADSQVKTEVNARLRELANAQNLVGVTEKAQKAAREKLRVTRYRYEEEAALLDDVLKAESNLAEANDAHIKAILSVWTAEANLAKALGED